MSLQFVWEVLRSWAVNLTIITYVRQVIIFFRLCLTQVMNSWHIKERHQYVCERGCDNVGFPSRRDLEVRHYGSKRHRESGGSTRQYRCGGCGKEDHRRDNHKRHLNRNCSGEAIASFICGRCGRDDKNDKSKHRLHVNECMEKRGAKKTTTVSQTVTDT